MKLGVIFPQIEMHGSAADVREYILAVESLGADYMVAYDHVLGANPERPGGWRGPYTYRDPFHEVFVLFAYAAAITTRLEFATGVLVLPQRQTALVAKQAAQLDFMSGGRLRLGVGIGWNAVEYDALDKDFKTRGRRSDEQVRLLRQLWTQDLVQFQGDFERVDDAGLRPLPIQRPIPVWFGGHADAVLERAARLGDGWIPNPLPMEDLRPQFDKLHGYLRAAGRESSAFGIDARLNASKTPRAAWQDYAAEYRALGATHLGLNTMGMGFTTVRQHLRVIEDFLAALRQ